MVNQSAPFAQALLEIGQENGLDERYLQEMKNIETVLQENPDLKTVLMHPQISTTEKKKLLDQLFSSEDDILDHFFQVVCAHKMSGSLGEIAEDYQRLFDQSRNIETVLVTTASAMDKDQMDRLQEALEKRLNHQVRLKVEVDPSLIAGLKIKTADATIDTSYQGRLEKMKEQLKKS